VSSPRGRKMPFDPKSANCSMGSALNFKSVSRNYLDTGYLKLKMNVEN
jgi:hypothetical protein